MAMMFPRTPTANIVAEVTRDLDSSLSAGNTLMLWLRERGGSDSETFVSSSPNAKVSLIIIKTNTVHKDVLEGFTLSNKKYSVVKMINGLSILRDDKG
ncbi:hypothetical protein EYF80_012757 [Liparis tanakae]|uniref:Uncharacterized protein n=1 Tax=Liparis tanakae TaxID=230148 RepID=A0A4Z2IGH4_9TELE|nr:hypothetical protein EYF80_012757 [Liparis tanakae]